MKNLTPAILLTTAFFALSHDVFAQREGGRRDFPGFLRDGPGEAIEPEDLDFDLGTATIPDRAMFERLSYQGPDAGRDSYLAGIEFVKFIIEDAEGEAPKVYFMNTENHRGHPPFMRMIGLGGFRDSVRGAISYMPRLRAPNGEPGLYIYDFQPNDSYAFEDIRAFHTALVAKAPLLEGRLAFHPLRGNVSRYEKDKEKYEAAELPVYLDDDKYSNISYLPLNPGVAFGRLRIMDDDARPAPRDIVIYKTLPNQMPRVAGVITEERQTPLSHVNLRAVQDKVPNAYIEGALQKDSIRSLVGRLVRYEITSQGHALRAATAEEVNAHFDESRPKESQSPPRDLTVTEIRPLKDITFKDSIRYGVKAANMAAMRRFGFPEGTIPDGFAVPFYFYDTFMKHNGFYETAEKLIADAGEDMERDVLAERLEEFRDAIEDGKMPPALKEALTELQKSFPASTSIRCRSSTNNEDLPNFSGAGLYDSYTHKPDEGHLSKSIKQVFASLWNARAFEERAFHRIDHMKVAMGVLLHPNFKGEKANGVAVTEDILYESKGFYYINTQIGEDLVTNPEENSSPEEVLLGWYDRDGHKIVRRSEHAPDGEGLLKEKYLEALRKYLGIIHIEFAELYERDPEDLKFAMEIEFKIDKDDRLVIKQARQWVF